MTISVSTAPIPAVPVTAAKLPLGEKLAPVAANFLAALESAQKPVVAKPKPVRVEKAALQTKESDPTISAPVPVLEQIAEVLAFGPPDAPIEGAPQQIAPELPQNPLAPKTISIKAGGPSFAKPAVPVTDSEEKPAPKPKPVLALNLSPDKPAEPQPQAEAPEPLQMPLAIAKPATSGAIVMERVPDQELNTQVAETAQPDPRPQAGHHTQAPQSVEHPSEIAPAEAPRVQPTNSKEITVRIADLHERATDVRFVERAGQVHVTVRTADAEFGRTIRSGVNDLITRLDHSGIRAELASESSNFKNDSRSSEDSQNESRQQQERRQQRKPQEWLEEFENQGGTSA